ncbi:MAG: fructose-6-phosphate aldolase [Alphaproteobacteria bacterium]
MKIFLDTADLTVIKELAPTGLVDGVTTNPSLVAKQGGDFLSMIAETCEVVSGPVSAEVAATDYETMLAEGKKLAKIADNVAVKVPLTEAGLRVCRALADQGTMVNVTLCFQPMQAVLAAKAGATFISPFIGRLDDIGQNGMELIDDIVAIYAGYPEFETQVLAASIRHTTHVLECARVGADVVTLPPELLRKMLVHPLTDSGLAAFVDDWKKTGQSIL